MTLSYEERAARLRLARTDRVGPVGYGHLLRQYGSGVAALQALADQGRKVAGEQVEAEFERAAALGARHIFLGEAEYPPLLAEVADPPPLLIVKGDSTLAARPVVGFVGARNASIVGRNLARQMAQELGAVGFVVVSGLARGIDGAVHEGALKTGTIACIAGGVDTIYPPEHERLQAAIAEQGLIVTEMPPGVEPLARHFPRRNRLIAGIARAVVVMEAAGGSGSLITARLAGEAGREVMVVPGHPSDPRSRGGNSLLKDGATLVESAEDVIAALSLFSRPLPSARKIQRQTPVDTALMPAAIVSDRKVGSENISESGDNLLQLLTVSGTSIDELVRVSGCSTAEVQARLADLELDGQIVRLAGGRVALCG